MLHMNQNARGSGVFINPKHANGNGTVELVIGVDAGSTQTRVAIADANDYTTLMVLSDTEPAGAYQFLTQGSYIIPSSFALVADEREIKPCSDNLEHNYDSRVIRVKTKAVEPVVGSHRIVRGQKVKDATGLVQQSLDSSTNKMDNQIFYLNVLDGIGYALLQKYNGAIPRNVKIHLVLSVRPNELNHICQTRMNDNFLGRFIFSWGGAEINMDIVTADYTTEPEAQVNGTAAVFDLAAVVTGDEEKSALADKINNSDSYIHIEGGGSSIGVEVIKNGNIINGCSKTFHLGGNYLTQVVASRLRDTLGRTVTRESAQEAVVSCLLRNGRERDDVTEIVAECKSQVGMDIMERLRHEVIGLSTDLSLRDMDFVTLGGRLFSDDDAGQSIGKYFARYLEQVSPNTDVIILQNSYIPQGNLIIGINKYDISGVVTQVNEQPVVVSEGDSK